MFPKFYRAVWGNLKKIFGKIYHALWGDLSKTEFKRFGLLSLGLLLTLGPYWMLRGVREALFIDLVGVRWQPWGKIASFIIILPLILLYSKLLDFVRKEKLFFVIYPIYIFIFISIASFIAFPQYQSIFVSLKALKIFSSVPGNLLGWFSYVFIESFGALAPALFWSFVASYTTTIEAKRGYGLIYCITQIGTMGGSLFMARYAVRLGLPIVILIASTAIACVPFIIQFYLSVHETAESKKKASFFRPNKPKTGFFEGLRLLIKQPYLFGIFIVTTGYEIIATLLEYQMNLLGHEVYPTKEAFAAFYGRFGFFTNGCAFLFALLGTSFFLRTFGLRICLLLFPITTGCVVVVTRLMPVLPVVFVSMIILKCLNYSLNNPSKEILYIPTSRDAKFKAKGWIDVFGLRGVKASGASINAFFRKLAPAQTVASATPILLAVVTVWALTARFVSVKNHKLVKENKIIK